MCLFFVVRLRDRGIFLVVELLCFCDWYVYIMKKVVNLEYCKFYGFMFVGWDLMKVDW